MTNIGLNADSGNTFSNLQDPPGRLENGCSPKYSGGDHVVFPALAKKGSYEDGFQKKSDLQITHAGGQPYREGALPLLPQNRGNYNGDPLPGATSSGASKWGSNHVAGGSVGVFNVAADSMDPSVTDNNIVADSLNIQATAPKMGPDAAIVESESAGDETAAAKCTVLQHSLADNGDLLPAGQGNAGYGVAGANEASIAISGGLSSDFQGSAKPNSDLFCSDEEARPKKSMLGAVRAVQSMSRGGVRAVM